MRQHVEWASEAKKIPLGKAADETHKAFAALLAANKLQQMKLEKKMAEVQKRQAAKTARTQIAELLSGDKIILNKGVEYVQQILASKVAKALDNGRLVLSEIDEIQMAVLRFEEKLLLSKMQQLGNAPN